MSKPFFNLLIVLSTLSFTGSALAEKTDIMLRAKAVDAKYIGTSVGGMRAIVEDAETGEILDEGWITGDTGDTKTLVEEPVKRGQQLTDADTAGFLASVDIEMPRLLRFKLIGPYGYRQSLQEATVTSWVIPGKHIIGDGITLTMPGFIVDAWSQVMEGSTVEVYTKASLLCGCPIREDGFWDPDNYAANAIIMQDERKIAEVSLAFSNSAALFSNKIELPAGSYQAIVYLIDQQTGNVGVDRTVFEVNAD